MGNLEAIFPAATREYAPLVEELWNNSAIRATCSRKDELKALPSVACYFLDRVVEISRTDYEPSKLDILYADGMTSTYGLACTDFCFPQSDSAGSDPSELEMRFQLMRLHTKGMGKNMKWLDMFEDVQLVIYCISLSDYDELYENDNGEIVNKMMANKSLFKSVVSHPTFVEMEFLLILTKFDLIEQMVDSSPLTTCVWFDDFDPVISRHHSHKNSHNANNCATLPHYIAVKFKRLFYSLTGRKFYVTMANGLNPESVDAAL